MIRFVLSHVIKRNRKTITCIPLVLSVLCQSGELMHTSLCKFTELRRSHLQCFLKGTVIFTNACFKIINKTKWTKPFLSLPKNLPGFETRTTQTPLHLLVCQGFYLYLLLKKDQKLSTARLWRAAAWPLSNHGDCCARFQRVCDRAALKSSAKPQPKGAPASSGPYFCSYIQTALISQSVCNQQ